MANKNISLQELRRMARAAKGCIDKIYLHWTAGNYGQYSDDYHICIDGDGTIVACCNDLTELKEHTWRRNSNAVGVAMCCCAGASAYAGGVIDFGEQPPTPAQIDRMAKVTAVLCEELGLEINRYNVMTHCEAAEIDGYGPSTTCERWDLWRLKDIPGDGQLKDGGDVIRGKAIWWQQNGV